MGYTWTDGELITATKLNNTGGSDYDFIIEYDGNDYVATKGTYSDVYTAMQTRVVSGVYKQLTTSGQTIWSRCIPFTYVWYYPSTSAINMYGVYHDGADFQYIYFIWNSDGTITD